MTSRIPPARGVQNNGRSTHRGGVTGRGFMPGQSGNPGGRPRAKNLRAYIKAMTAEGRDLVDGLLKIVRRKGKPDVLTLKAIQELLDRGFGKAVLTTALTGLVDGDVESDGDATAASARPVVITIGAGAVAAYHRRHAPSPIGADSHELPSEEVH